MTAEHSQKTIKQWLKINRVPKTDQIAAIYRGREYYLVEQTIEARTVEQWLREWMHPLQEASPIFSFESNDYFARDHVEAITTRTHANRSLRKSVSGLSPCAVRYVKPRGGQFCEVYRVSELKPLRPKPAAKEIDLLLAIWTINRAAKRMRDLAKNYYLKGVYGLATKRKEQKDHFYDLKDRGIVAAYRQGIIQFVEIVEYENGTALAVYQGGGYYFHSFLVPSQILASLFSDDADSVAASSVVRYEEGELLIEAKPKSKNEGRRIDAIATLQKLPFDGFQDFDDLRDHFFKRTPADENEPSCASNSILGEGSDQEDEWDTFEGELW